MSLKGGWSPLLVGLVILGAALAAVSGALFVTVSSNSGQSTTHTLVVSASGQVTYTPDEVQVYIGFSGIGSTTVNAAEANSAIDSSIRSNLASISGANISLTSYNVCQRQSSGYFNSCNSYSTNPPNQSNYYVVSSIIQVSLIIENFSLLKKLTSFVIDGATTANAILLNVQFKVSAGAMNALIAEASQNAVKNAQSEAQQIASSTGVQIIRMDSLTQENGNFPPSTVSTFSPGVFYNQPAFTSQTVSVSVEVTFQIT